MASSAVVWGVLALGFWGFRGGPYQLRTKRLPFFLFLFIYYFCVCFLHCFLFMEIYMFSYFFFLKNHFRFLLLGMKVE